MFAWPNSLRLKTRKFLDGIIPFPTGDVLHMENIYKFFAYIKKEDLVNGKIILYDKDTNIKTQFNSVGDLFDAGWAIDIKFIVN